jgi:16S rRNA (cytidine1402-2'-O)-methyltransferase
MSGRLVLVATPIGNLDDLTPRARQALGAADVICCEDTRRTGRLLQHAGIAPPRLVVVNEHTEVEQVPHVLSLLAQGKRVAVVSDSGMPGVSDPGEKLVRAAVDAGYQVEVVPGPSAAVAALVISGLPTGRFVFEGFLPKRGRPRAERLAALATESRTMVLFEAPHRLHRTLGDLAGACGEDRRVVVVRELTKLHEEVWRGDLAGAADWVATDEPPGEMVLIVAGAPAPPPVTDEVLRSALQAALDNGASVRDAAAQVASDLDVPRRRAYELALSLTGS